MVNLSNKLIGRLLKHRLLLHILFWIVVTIYFTLGYGKPGHYGVELIRSLSFLPNHIWLAYSFMYFLLPKFLFRNKIYQFLVLAAICIAASMYFSKMINYGFLGYFNISTSWSVGLSLLGQLTILGIAVSLKLLRYWYKQNQEILQAQKEKLLSELDMLKSQIHPHFLFNTLNNLYSLTLEKSDMAANVVLKLSGLLRYMLYECNSDFVLLEKEIETMKNYVELEKIRYGDRLDISIHFSGDIKGKLIPPLLFLPLLENAFKFGTSKQIDQCWISINMHIENSTLKFKLVNSKNQQSDELIFSGGIGLQNVQKRLQLLYGDNFYFKTSPTEETYTVSLTIPVNDSEMNAPAIPEIPNQSQLYENKMYAGG